MPRRAGMSPARSCLPSQVNDLFAQRDAETRADVILASTDQRTNVVGGRAAGIDDEICVRRRHLRASLSDAFQPGTIDERTGRVRDTVWHEVDRRLRVLKYAPGTWRFQWLGALAECQRVTGDGPERHRITSTDPKIHGEHN